MQNAIFNNAPSFIFGEWFQGNTSDSLYHDSYKFANKSGISLLDFPLNTAIRDVFANNNAFSEIDSTVTTENSNFTWQNDLVTFVDNHDMPPLLSVNTTMNPLNTPMPFFLPSPALPSLYSPDY